MNKNRIIFESAKDFQDYLFNLETMPKGHNRQTKDLHIQLMTVSVLKLGVTRMINVVRTSVFGKKDGLYILDGQHLRKAILGLAPSQLRGDFIVTIMDIDDKEEIVSTIALLNSTSANYKLEDFLESWCTVGKKDYILLQDTLRRTKLKINPIVEAYSMQKSTGNKDFKEGRFTANVKQLDSILNLYNTAIKAGLTRTNAGFSAIVRLKIDYPHLNDKDVVNAVKKNPAFGFTSNRHDFIRLFKETIDIRK
jgi:hypothetical protein